MKITDYKIIRTAAGQTALILRVREAISEGWQSHGSLVYADGVWSQPVVKYGATE